LKLVSCFIGAAINLDELNFSAGTFNTLDLFRWPTSPAEYPCMAILPRTKFVLGGRSPCRISWFRKIARGQRSHRFWEQRKYKKRVARVGIQPPLEINFESLFLLEESGFRCMVLYMLTGVSDRTSPSNNLHGYYIV